MKKYTEALEVDTFYHIYNRGNNGDDVFFEERNYEFFLQKYRQYVYPIADTYAYCLMKNHFHILVRIKPEKEILAAGEIPGGAVSILQNMSKTISNQWAKLFNAYTQAMNKVYSRSGSLFEKPFRRKEVKSDDYFSKLVHYIHFNPQSHGFVDDFRNYQHSSYSSHLSDKATNLMRTELMGWFGDTSTYNDFTRRD